ncbi:endonuclease [Psychromonas marina]|uniref:Endonuclease n=1 Tax=Psychromonas marina TaxID=88364 RepID=A0ABQ6DVE3_9GAMM|nr:DNA/RNA non-specific endonuclease [Psychromonas marina]GLS89087.1 endonuclease [Psychromonas marina]
MKKLINALKKIAIVVTLFSTSAFSDILSVHCPLACPESPPKNDLIFAHIYALSNNPITKFADWVAYEVNPINFGPSTGRIWKTDPLLSDNETLEANDYKGANSSVLEADRGHQAPLASFAGSQYWYEVNYLSNITPQDKDLNQGAWKNLEDAIRDSSSYKKPLYVITGPLFTKKMPDLPKADESHVIPSGYFKIVYDQSGATAFVMQQNSNRKDNYCLKKLPVSSIQALVNFQLPNLQPSKEVSNRLGCN